MQGFEARLREAIAARSSVVTAPSNYAPLLAFSELLEKWNATHNLTSVSDPVQWVDALFVDSWLVSSVLPAEGTLVDVGSGGGFPALVLLSQTPQRPALLFEKDRKKRSFLQVAIAALGLSARVAPGAFPGELPAGPRVFTSRATWAPADWLAIARKQAAPGDQIIVQSSQEALPPDAVKTVETTLPLTGSLRRIGLYGQL